MKREYRIESILLALSLGLSVMGMVVAGLAILGLAILLALGVIG